MQGLVYSHSDALTACYSKDLAVALRQRVNKVRRMKRVQQDTTPSHAGSGQRILFTGK